MNKKIEKITDKLAYKLSIVFEPVLDWIVEPIIEQMINDEVRFTKDFNRINDNDVCVGCGKNA